MSTSSLCHNANFPCPSFDRTNFIQDILSRTTLEQFLYLVRREWLHSVALWSYHRELWAENGDALSRIYAGTGALNTSFTRSGKRTLAGEYLGVMIPTCYFMLIVLQVSFLTQQRVSHVPISITSRTKANKSLLICSW